MGSRLPSIRDVFPDYFPRSSSRGPAPRATSQPPPHHHNHPQIPVQPAPRFFCETCGRAFSRPSTLEVHNRSHTGERPYACTHPGCNRRYQTNSNLNRHYRTHHGGVAGSSRASVEAGRESSVASTAGYSVRGATPGPSTYGGGTHWPASPVQGRPQAGSYRPPSATAHPTPTTFRPTPTTRPQTYASPPPYAPARSTTRAITPVAGPSRATGSLAQFGRHQATGSASMPFALPSSARTPTLRPAAFTPGPLSPFSPSSPSPSRPFIPASASSRAGGAREGARPTSQPRR